jgi:hypothetical protein
VWKDLNRAGAFLPAFTLPNGNEPWQKDETPSHQLLYFYNAKFCFRSGLDQSIRFSVCSLTDHSGRVVLLQ